MSLDIEALPSPPTTEHGPISVHVEWEVDAEVCAGHQVVIETSAEVQDRLKVEQVDEPKIIACEDDNMAEMEISWEGLLKEMEGRWKGLIKEIEAEWESLKQQQQQNRSKDKIAPPQAEFQPTAVGQIDFPALKAEAANDISPAVIQQATKESVGHTSDSLHEAPQKSVINLQKGPPLKLNGAPEHWVTWPEMLLPEAQEIEALLPSAENEQVKVSADAIFSEDIETQPQTKVWAVDTAQDENDSVSVDADTESISSPATTAEDKIVAANVAPPNPERTQRAAGLKESAHTEVWLGASLYLDQSSKCQC